MGTFNGQLKSNEIFGALFNMIISQQIFADNIAGTNSALVDKAKVDGTLFGDTKLFYATDVLKSHEWLGDNEAQNLLAIDRPAAPECQAITIDTYRQIRLTTDNYLSKRAWSDEGTFSSFNSVMLGWMGDTKKVYDSTTYNVYLGTTESLADRAVVEVGVTAATQGLSGEEKNRVEAETIANSLADVLDDLEDISRDFNDYKFLRSYNEGDIKIIWNKKWRNKITKRDLPTIFHKDGLMDKFTGDSLPARYFGEVGTDAITKAENDGTKRSTIEADYATAVGANVIHVFPGDIIPSGTAKVLTYQPATKTKYSVVSEPAKALTISAGIAANEYYTVDDDVICKIYVKLPPYMSAFEVGTNFYNPRSLTENHYLTFGHNTLEYLKNYPFITVHAD